MGQLQGKVALITGSGRGQGLAAAKRFAAEGAKIVINDLDEQSVNSAIAAVHTAGGEAVGAVGDVSKAADVQRVLAVAKEKHGGIDILLRCALRHGEQLASMSDIGGAVFAVGEQPVVADAMQALGQNMDQKASDELVPRQRHGLVPAVPLDSIILPFEGDAGLVG